MLPVMLRISAFLTNCQCLNCMTLLLTILFSYFCQKTLSELNKQLTHQTEVIVSLQNGNRCRICEQSQDPRSSSRAHSDPSERKAKKMNCVNNYTTSSLQLLKKKQLKNIFDLEHHNSLSKNYD